MLDDITERNCGYFGGKLIKLAQKCENLTNNVNFFNRILKVKLFVGELRT